MTIGAAAGSIVVVSDAAATVFVAAEVVQYSVLFDGDDGPDVSKIGFATLNLWSHWNGSCSEVDPDDDSG